LAETHSPAANIYVDFAASLAVVSELADPALRLAGLSPSDKAQIALGIGLAGLSCANEVPRFTNGLRVETVHDAVTACIGANGAMRAPTVVTGEEAAAAEVGHGAHAVEALTRRVLARGAARIAHGLKLPWRDALRALCLTTPLDRRIPDKPKLIKEVAAWQPKRHHAKADWQFRKATPASGSKVYILSSNDTGHS
jgi:hypothetical protein